MREKNVDEVRMLCLALINSSYELNDIIPNIEMMMYRIFISPQLTKEARQKSEEGDLLEGNLFCKENVNLGPAVYRSLLETMALYPKKKHFKKLIQHVIRYEDKENITPELLHLITYIGIDQGYPILMGHTMKYFLANDYQVSPRVFRDFVLFLERSKGFEEDAKRFVSLTSDTTHIQMNYELLRPLFIRTIQNKTGQEVLKLFEQFRKTLKLNASWKDNSPTEKSEALRNIKIEVYDGLIKDLLAVHAHQLSQVIYNEKMKEKYTMTMGDHLTGMEIYAVQKMLPEYQTKFKEVFVANTDGFPIDQSICEEMARMLQYFNSQDVAE